MRIGYRLRRHDEGVHDARPDGEPDETAMLRGIASGIDQEYTQDGIYPTNHLQVILRLPPVPHPPRRPNQRTCSGICVPNTQSPAADRLAVSNRGQAPSPP